MNDISNNAIRFSQNNLDIIRLFAAFQVALKHALVHLKVDDYYIELVSVFPGVPIFFFISGLLIYRSYSNSGSLLQYFVNRVLRIYPALIVCFFVSVLSVLLVGYLRPSDLMASDFIIWAVAQLTFFQFYNPDLLREYGVGVLNGSLGTISIELQFYFLTPILFAFVSGRKWLWILLLVFFAIFNFFHTHWVSENIFYKLFVVSFVPWFALFVLGAWFSTREDFINYLVGIPVYRFFLLYGLVEFICYSCGLAITGNNINFISFLFLSILVVRLAYVNAGFSDRVLKKNDISYGVYIYHMPLVNLFIFFGLTEKFSYVFIVLALTFLIAIMSWYFIEKPMLALKKKSLR